MAVHRFDEETARDVTGLVQPEDLDLGALFQYSGEAERWRALVAMIEGVACRAGECCAEATTLAEQPPDWGGIIQLRTNDSLDVNGIGAAIGWDVEDRLHADFYHPTGAAQRSKVVIKKAGLYRLYAGLNFKSVTIGVRPVFWFAVNGAPLFPEGRQGRIETTNGRAGAAVETVVELSVDDYVQVMAAQDEVPGTATLVAGKSVLIAERKPQ